MRLTIIFAIIAAAASSFATLDAGPALKCRAVSDFVRADTEHPLLRRSFARNIKPSLEMAKSRFVAIKKGTKIAANNVKAACQNAGNATNDCLLAIVNGEAEVAGDTTVGAGKTVADAPKSFINLLNSLKRKAW
jgi:hypothetical protein